MTLKGDRRSYEEVASSGAQELEPATSGVNFSQIIAIKTLE